MATAIAHASEQMVRTSRRVMEITTPLGPDALLFHRMRAREELSRLSDYRVSLLSLRDIDLNEILGMPVSITVALANDAPREVREFNGYVTEIAQHGTHGRFNRYTATVSPWLWFLTRTSDCRVFQDMTVREIVEAIFAHHPADCLWRLTDEYRKWPYCVQYRETNFNFVSRLLEHEGIYYYFTHADGRNTMVLTDSYPGHDVFPGYSSLPFIGKDRPGRSEVDHVSAWKTSRQVQPGAYTHRDYDPERPNVNLLTRAISPRSHARSHYERFDYPGHYVQKQDGERYAAVRIDEYASRFEKTNAATNAKGVAVGRLLTLTDHPREDQNREYLVTSATYQLDFSDYEAIAEKEGAKYHCRFTAMPTSQQFRPRQRAKKPTIQGMQTAIVVADAGNEIDTDALGRVRVRFHWDRHGAADHHTSCWVRVSQFWAGHGFGAMFLPRVNQEVVVDFLEGDPDQPIIIGRVYNGSQKPPYELPANQTQSGVKSRSTPDGTITTCNEIRFEDKKGQEEFFMQAERAMTIRVKGSEHHTVGGSQTTAIAKDHKVEVSQGSYSLDVNQKHMLIRVPNAEFQVMGKFIRHTADKELYANVGESTIVMVPTDLSLSAPNKIVAEVLGNVVEIDPAGVSVTARARITLQCGSSKIELTPAGIQLSSEGAVAVKGLPISISSTGPVDVKGLPILLNT